MGLSRNPLHGGKPDYAGAVALQNARGEVLLLRRGPTAPWMPGRWNLPGGMAERGESPPSAAIRETHEEAGVVPVGLKLLDHVRGAHGSTFVYLARGWRGRLRLGWENDMMAWVPLDVALRTDLVPGTRRALQRLLAMRSMRPSGVRRTSRGR